MHVGSSQLYFQIVILYELMAKTGVYMKYKIILILPSISTHQLSSMHVPNFLAYSQDNERRIKKKALKSRDKRNVSYSEDSGFPCSPFDSPCSALWISASDRSINRGILEALKFSEAMMVIEVKKENTVQKGNGGRIESNLGLFFLLAKLTVMIGVYYMKNKTLS